MCCVLCCVLQVCHLLSSTCWTQRQLLVIFNVTVHALVIVIISITYNQIRSIAFPLTSASVHELEVLLDILTGHLYNTCSFGLYVCVCMYLCIYVCMCMQYCALVNHRNDCSVLATEDIFVYIAFIPNTVSPTVFIDDA